MQIYVGLSSDSEILLGEKKAGVYARTEKWFMFVLSRLIVLELLIFTYTASSISAEVYVLLEK